MNDALPPRHQFADWRKVLCDMITAGDYGTDEELGKKFGVSKFIVGHYRRNILGIRRESWGGAHNLTGNGTSTRIPTTVGFSPPTPALELRWTEEEVQKFRMFFRRHDATEREILLRAAKAGDPEAVQTLWTKYRLRFISAEERMKVQS